MKLIGPECLLFLENVESVEVSSWREGDPDMQLLFKTCLQSPVSPALRQSRTAMTNNKVPANWEVAAYPSLKPLASWIKDLHERLRIMRAWLVGGQPAAFWISGFCSASR